MSPSVFSGINPISAVWSNITAVFSLLFAAATNLLLGANTLEMVEISDEELARRMGQGDEEAFNRLYERYFPKVYGFVVRRVSHHEVAEDLVSDVFMKAFAHRRNFVWKTSFAAWIFRIATNRLTDHYRTRKTTEELDDEHTDHPSGALGPEGNAEQKLLGEELERVIERLNERERMIVTMKFYAECTNEEIAKALNVTPNNAGVILHRALAKCEKLASEKLKAMMAS